MVAPEPVYYDSSLFDTMIKEATEEDMVSPAPAPAQVYEDPSIFDMMIKEATEEDMTPPWLEERRYGISSFSGAAARAGLKPCCADGECEECLQRSNQINDYLLSSLSDLLSPNSDVESLQISESASALVTSSTSSASSSAASSASSSRGSGKFVPVYDYLMHCALLSHIYHKESTMG